MNDFIGFVIHLLKISMVRGTVETVLVGVGFLLYHWKRGLPINWRKEILDILLVFYLSIAVYVTTQRYTGGGTGVNFHLFRAWRNAFNTWRTTQILNPILNIAMFLPFGILLPLRWQWAQKPGWLLLAGFSFSLLLEACQYLNANGILDIDDLLCNTLGAMGGFGLCMAVLTWRQRKGNPLFRCLGYLTIPLGIAGSIGLLFLAYLLQPYGSLRSAPDHRINTRRIQWKLTCPLDDVTETTVLYKLDIPSSEECLTFALHFTAQQGLFPDTFTWYDENLWVESHGSPNFLLTVSRQSPGYCFSCRSRESGLTQRHAESTVREILSEYDIWLPRQAAFDYNGTIDQQGVVAQLFLADGIQTDDSLIDGSVACGILPDGTLLYIDHQMFSYTRWGEANLISQKEAYEILIRGWFAGDNFEAHKPNTVEVYACRLDYELDTKGFRHPVWKFGLFFDGRGEVAVISATK